MPFHIADLIAILMIVALNGLLSADNALVLAVLVLGLPKSRQQKALRYGIIGAFGFQTVAALLARYLLRLDWVKLVGSLYLLYLSYKHFFQSGTVEERRKPRVAKAWVWIGLSAFWTTVVKVELTDIMFAVDSILVAVAISPNQWVVITGLILGVIVMRLLIGQLLALIRTYPAIVDGAFVIIAWVGMKLVLEYLYQVGYVRLEIPRWFSMGLIVVIFGAAFLYARRQGPADAAVEEPAAALLDETDV